MSKGVLVAVALGCAAWGGAEDVRSAVAFMREVVGLGPSQLASVEAGEVITKQLATTDKSEVAAFGAVRVHGARAAFLRHLRADVGRTRRGAILEIGRFSRPPRVEDAAALTLDADSLAAVRACRPGDCAIKLSRSAMDRIQGTIDWKAADAAERSAQLVKEMLVDYTAAYMKGGTAAMATYADKERPLESSAEFAKVLGASPFLIEYVPALHRYAEEYPAGSLAGAEDFFYWCRDKYAPKPTVSLFHVVIWDDPQRDFAVVAWKRIYASHYFRAGVELLAAVDAPGGGFYLMDLYRARIDPPTGMLSGAILGKVRGGIEQAVGENLKTLATTPLD